MARDHKKWARQKTLALRVWAFCTPRAWDVSIPEIADELDVEINAIVHTITREGWTGRVRAVRYRPVDVPMHAPNFGV